jgi:hypothetical protein
MAYGAFFDGFSHYSTLSDMGWIGAGGTVSPTGGVVRTGNGYATTNGNTGGARRVMGGTATRMIGGFRFKFDTISSISGGRNVVAIEETAAPIIHVGFVITASLVFAAYRGGAGGTLLGTATNTPLNVNRSYFLEWDVTVHDTLGSIDLWLDGASILSLSGIDTRNGGSGVADTFEWAPPWSSGSGQNWYITDFYCLDATLAAPLNARIGDCGVYTIVPTGAGTTTAWTPLSGSNWQNVDEIPPTSDTDYNSTATVAAVDLYAFADLTPTSGIVLGLEHLIYARKDDAGVRTVQAMVRSGGSTVTDGAVQTLATTYAYSIDLSRVNPVTAVAWTIADVNAAEYGMKEVA